MKCQKIVAHIRRTEDKDKISKVIIAFGQRFRLVSTSGFGWNEVEATYIPEDDVMEQLERDLLTESDLLEDK